MKNQKQTNLTQDQQDRITALRNRPAMSVKEDIRIDMAITDIMEEPTQTENQRQRLIDLLNALEGLQRNDVDPKQALAIGRLKGELTQDILALDPTDLAWLTPTPEERKRAVAHAKNCGAW